MKTRLEVLQAAILWISQIDAEEPVGQYKNRLPETPASSEALHIEDRHGELLSDVRTTLAIDFTIYPASCLVMAEVPLRGGSCREGCSHRGDRHHAVSYRED